MTEPEHERAAEAPTAEAPTAEAPTAEAPTAEAPTAEAPTARLEAVVHGRVQGVGFRVYVRRTARGLGLTGWVANEPGGRVRCVAEGPTPALDRLLRVLRAGLPGALVESVDVAWPPATGEFGAFDVRSGWHPGD